MSNKIVLVGDYDYNYQQALKKVVYNIQTQFDINPMIIQEWLDRDNFDEILEKKDRGCYRKIMSQPNDTLDKLLDVTYAETFVNEYLFWEKEKCGQIVDEFSNGYTKYCNKHKYLHNNKKGLTKKPADEKNSVDHYFVEKNPNEIMEEQIFKIRFNIYLKYNRLLAQVLENEFYAHLQNDLHYTSFYVKSDDGSALVEWLQQHPLSFRSKFPTYSGDIKKSRSESDESEKVYIKVYVSENDKDLPDFEIISSDML